MVLLKSILRHRWTAEAKKSPLFLCHNFQHFMEKEPCAEFCGVVIRSHEVMKL